MAIWEWFKGIPPRTRIIVGVGIMAYASAGLYLSDKAEEHLRRTATEKEEEELRNRPAGRPTVEKRND
ncbi:hypothetical protein BDW02DRAFT_599864 [Decorospora gaudefroyi]|uniref:Uncharacterized protein n=1 Tax=Decorospora gaudefroyi TaxID=184978 RepID=A0A6A5KDP8_9PLEO|nr:hypothetical protein BDW02DRAFT_599864 [Decorospora gaudefroyi]